MWKILSLTRTADQTQEEGSHLGEEEEEEDPRDSRITTQETHISIVSIMAEDTAMKGAQKPRKHRKNSARKSFHGHRILNAEPTTPEFLAATVHELSTKSSRNAAISTTTAIIATLSAIFPSIAGNSVNPATTANSINLATTTRQFVKTRINFKTPELESLSIVRDHHANFGRVCHGIRN
jgi:hypothetical protein